MTGTCERVNWSGREAWHLVAGGYEATVVPSLGANVISLLTSINGHKADIVRTPPSDQALLADPYAYGMPVLFPANRIAGGRYTWDGVTYDFPRNYPNDVHIHGVLHNREWPVVAKGAGEGAAWIHCALDTDSDASLRAHFPVSMAIRLEISLSAEGLKQRFVVENRTKDLEIPAGLAYHTALNVGFCGGHHGVRLHVPLQGRCIDDPADRLPSGHTAPLDAYETRIASPTGADPLEAVVDYLYTARPGTTDAVMRDARSGCEVVYRAGAENHYWILWNRTATEGFIAVEPQTWLSNAMHTASPRDNGVAFVSPGQSWSVENILFAQAIKE